MALPFINPISQSMPGFGSPSYYGAATQVITTTTGLTTLVIANTSTTPSSNGTPFNTSGGPPPSRGKVRIRATAINASTTVAVTITVTDGTTTAQIAVIPATVAGLAAFDYSFEFTTDLSITSVSFNVTLGGGTFTATIDAEVSLV